MRPLTRVLQQVEPRWQVLSTFRTRPCGIQDQSRQQRKSFVAGPLHSQHFSTARVIQSESSTTGRGEKLKHDGTLDRKIGQAKEKQIQTPWHTEGADQLPVQRLRSVGAMTKGMLITFRGSVLAAVERFV